MFTNRGRPNSGNRNVIPGPAAARDITNRLLPSGLSTPKWPRAPGLGGRPRTTAGERSPAASCVAHPRRRRSGRHRQPPPACARPEDASASAGCRPGGGPELIRCVIQNPGRTAAKWGSLSGKRCCQRSRTPHLPPAYLLLCRPLVMDVNPQNNHRILIIDDNRAIHDDFRKILGSASDLPNKLSALEGSLFGAEASHPRMPVFQIDSAFQGQEGLDLIEKSLQENNPYAMAFVDVRMPPGWDGVGRRRESGRNTPTCRLSSARPIRIIPGRTC